MTQSSGGKKKRKRKKETLGVGGDIRVAGVSDGTTAAAGTTAVLTPHLVLSSSVLLSGGSMKKQHKGREGPGKSCYSHTHG